MEVADNPAMTLERRFVADLPAFGVRCTSPDDPLEDHVLLGSGELRLYGLLAETAYDCAVTDVFATELWRGSFVTGPVPEQLPALVVSGDADAATIDDGYLLFPVWEDQRGVADEDPRLVVVDGQGRVRWYQDQPEAVSGGIAATWLGDRMVVGGGGVTPSIRDLSGDVLFSVGPPRFPEPTVDVYHHEAELTPEGLLSLQEVPDETWAGFVVEITDLASGEVVWAFDSREAALLPPGTPTDDDPYHANAARWHDGAVWVSLRGLDALLRIDRSTGDTELVGHGRGITLEDADGDPLPDEQWFYGQHAPWFDGDEIWVYDNGSSRPGPNASRVARFRRDAPDRATLLWEWTEPGWYEPNWGSVAPLADGRALIASGHCPDCPDARQDARSWILELDGDTVVWRVDFVEPAHATYRAAFVDGCALFANRRTCP